MTRDEIGVSHAGVRVSSPKLHSTALASVTHWMCSHRIHRVGVEERVVVAHLL